jgi:hypothetical protein
MLCGQTDRQPAAGIFVRDVMHKNFAVNQNCLRAVTNFVLLFCRQAVRMFPRSERIPAVASGHLALSCPSVRPSVCLPQWNSWTFAKIQFCLKPATERHTLLEELPIFVIHDRDWPFVAACSFWGTTWRSKHNSRLWFIGRAAAYNVTTTYDISHCTYFRLWSTGDLLLRYEENVRCGAGRYDRRKMLKDTTKVRFCGCSIFYNLETVITQRSSDPHISQLLYKTCNKFHVSTTN